MEASASQVITVPKALHIQHHVMEESSATLQVFPNQRETAVQGISANLRQAVQPPQMKLGVSVPQGTTALRAPLTPLLAIQGHIMEVTEQQVQVHVSLVQMAPSATLLVLLLLMANVQLATTVQLDSLWVHHLHLSAHLDTNALQVLAALESANLDSIKTKLNKILAKNAQNDSTVMQTMVGWRITIHFFAQRDTTALMALVFPKNFLVQLVLSIT